MYIVDYVTPGQLSDSTISTFLISRNKNTVFATKMQRNGSIKLRKSGKTQVQIP